MAEKTEKPTPYKLKKSKEQGDLPKSQELAKLIILAMIMGIVCFSCTQFYVYFSQLFDVVFIITKKSQQIPMAGLPEQVIRSSIPYLIVAITCVLLINMLAYWIQFGPVVVIKSVMPKLSAISPVKNLKSFFSMQKFWLIIITLLKCLLLLILLVKHIEADINTLVTSVMSASMPVLVFGLKSMMYFIWKAILILSTFAIFDLLIQKKLYLKKQKMSMEEIKKEYKDNDGDPMIKGIRRSMAMSLLQSPPSPRPSPPADKANMILVNPLHYAVALYYQPGETPLPLVLYKVRAWQARQYCTLAQQQGKPVIQKVWLTRRIFFTTDVGEFIPLETINQVAKIYSSLSHAGTIKK
ncbi:EscU/YscU/HrcU family type III secretion system export apparatus switch protein [Cedecea sp.]|jgi:type III secretion protein U|uniref:EscU/YscU/HrcU family type III secretion system export apparatus switch protein n=1 Tax=Cedecea sp. TaxID=1970739 RepID=UPI002F401881